MQITDTIFQLDTLYRMLLQLGTSLVLLRFIYYRYSPNRDALLGFMVFGYGVFLISRLLSQVDISIGFAFGLFAVLSMLRYRTEALGVREMTYLFIVIVVALLCAVAPVDLTELVAISIFVCVLTGALETSFFAPYIHTRRIQFDNLRFIKPAQYPQLVEEVGDRTGLDIVGITIDEIDYLRDSAKLRVLYRSNP